jgi:hypothetical protein
MDSLLEFIALIIVCTYLGGLAAVAIALTIIDVRTDRERDPTPALWWPMLLWRYLRKVAKLPPKKQT